MAANFTGIILSTNDRLNQNDGTGSPSIRKIPPETFEPNLPLFSGEGRVPQGSIVNCSSVISIMSLPGTVSYTISKHTVVGVTRSPVLEAREHGIRVNAVSPGFVFTSLQGVPVKGEKAERLEF
jgi:NAD(P)-dependent dehydrogenase (short-subunit alcohol dehydrogenase family)